jgi:hypothetical protein
MGNLLSVNGCANNAQLMQLRSRCPESDVIRRLRGLSASTYSKGAIQA